MVTPVVELENEKEKHMKTNENNKTWLKNAKTIIQQHNLKSTCTAHATKPIGTTKAHDKRSSWTHHKPKSSGKSSWRIIAMMPKQRVEVSAAKRNVSKQLEWLGTCQRLFSRFSTRACRQTISQARRAVLKKKTLYRKSSERLWLEESHRISKIK
jgi:hypothetical protein